MEHLENPYSIIRECYRVLKKNRKLVIFTPSHDRYTWIMAEKIHNILTKSNSEHVTPLTKDLLQDLLQKNFSRYFIRRINFTLTLCGIAIK